MAIGPIASGHGEALPARATGYAWAVFALTFGLLLSDYMARQVLNAVFPLLKAEWALSDARLGLLSSIVAASVGILSFPLSLAADRWGRVKSLTIMAVLWSLATLLCGVARSYEQMLAGRLLVGVGEAAYGSVGLAVVLTAFPLRMRATLSGLFFAGTLFGQVVGVASGGIIGAAFGWRAAFLAIGSAGLVLALAYPLVVRERRIAALLPARPAGTPPPAPAPRPPLASVFASRTMWFAFGGTGVQCYVMGSLAAWMPSYFTRYYGVPLDRAGAMSAVFLLIAGLGTAACGTIADRAARTRPTRKASAAMICNLLTALLLTAAFQLPPGPAQLVVLGGALFVAIGSIGPSTAMVANVTPTAWHGTTFALGAFANNIFGLAPGPLVTGRIADEMGLLAALQFAPLAALVAAGLLFFAQRAYAADLDARGAVAPPPLAEPALP